MGSGTIKAADDLYFASLQFFVCRSVDGESAKFIVLANKDYFKLHFFLLFLYQKTNYKLTNNLSKMKQIKLNKNCFTFFHFECGIYGPKFQQIIFNIFYNSLFIKQRIMKNKKK